MTLEKAGSLNLAGTIYSPGLKGYQTPARGTEETHEPSRRDGDGVTISTASLTAPPPEKKVSQGGTTHSTAIPEKKTLQVPPAHAPKPPVTSNVPLTLAILDDEPAAKLQRPLLGTPPQGTRLPEGERERSRVLINSMIMGSPPRETRKLLADQLEAYGIDAISLVHNHGTRIAVIPEKMSIEEMSETFHMTAEHAKELKTDVGGVFESGPNVIYLREDLLSDGIKAPISAFIARHEFAHALDDALGDELQVGELFLKAKKGIDAHPVTTYAGTGRRDYFADSTASYLAVAGEFTGSMGSIGRALSGLATSFSGYTPRTRTDLQERDPSMDRMLSTLFKDKIPSRMPALRHQKDGDYDAWLWRAHQVNPDDSRVRIALLEREKSRRTGTEGEIQAEKLIEAEYQRVEKALVDGVKSKPGDRKGVFRLLEHYFERADRLPEGTRRDALEDRAIKTSDFYLRQGAANHPVAGTPRGAMSPAEERDFIVGQFKSHRMERAVEHLEGGENRENREKIGKSGTVNYFS